MSNPIWLSPTDPTKARVGPVEKQVQSAKLLADNYYRSSAWRTGYEWRQADALEAAREAAEAANGNGPLRPVTPKPTYSWQNLTTARDYIRAANDQNAKIDRIRAGEVSPQLQSESEAPLVDQPTDSLDQLQYHHTHRSQAPSPMRPTYTQTQYAGGSTPQPNATCGPTSLPRHTGLLLAGVPLMPTGLPGDGATHTRANDANDMSDATLVRRLGRAVRPANFHLRGAGALPTHRHTTRTATSRHIAGGQVPPHLHAQAQVANMDWSGWARSVEAKLNESRGTLQVGATRQHARRAP